MGRTVSFAPGYAPEDDVQFDPLIDDFASKERNYLHFDRPLTDLQRQSVRATPPQVLSHAFWPLLAFSKVERRVKRDKSGKLVFKDKVRDIKFCSHQDAALLERYTSWLSTKYEETLSKLPFKDSILAYRRGVGSNICQAKSLFEEIRTRKHAVAIAMDISGFFDHIDHATLLAGLKSILSADRIGDADYKIFKRLTRFEWVDADALEQRLSGKKRLAGRICDGYQFRKYVRSSDNSLIRINTGGHGIPQGTPLSGLYANISLIAFDAAVYDYVISQGGSFRRYSDDIALVLPTGINPTEAISFVRDRLKRIGLSLSEAKTETATFSTCSNGTITATKPFQYLGFTFDGKKILIRQSSLNRFYSKMKSGVYAKVLSAKAKGVPSTEIYMRELYRKYTHFGKHRNFPRYAYRAAREMGAPEIRAQLANHFTLFKEMVRLSISALY